MSTRKSNPNSISSVFNRTRRVAPAKTSDNCDEHPTSHFSDHFNITNQYLEACKETIIVPHLEDLEEPRPVETVQMPTANLTPPRYETFVQYQPPKSSDLISSRSNHSTLNSARSSATYVIEDNAFLRRSDQNLSLNLMVESTSEAGLLSILQPDLHPSLSDLESNSILPRHEDEGTIGDSLLHSRGHNDSRICIDIPEHPGPDGERPSTKKGFRLMKRFRGVFRNNFTMFAVRPPKAEQIKHNIISISPHDEIGQINIRHPKQSVSERLRNSFTSNYEAICCLFRRKPQSEPLMFDDDEFWVNN